MQIHFCRRSKYTSPKLFRRLMLILIITIFICFRAKQIGFEVKLKPFINRSDGSSKGDWDVGITIDIMEYASKSDIIVLASGDGDFDILMDRVKTLYNSKTEIYGVANLTAISLKIAPLISFQ